MFTDVCTELNYSLAEGTQHSALASLSGSCSLPPRPGESGGGRGIGTHNCAFVPLRDKNVPLSLFHTISHFISGNALLEVIRRS